MEDILASIRRILNEDEVAPPARPASCANRTTPASRTQPNAGGSGGDDDGVLVLDEAMLVRAEPDRAGRRSPAEARTGCRQPCSPRDPARRCRARRCQPVRRAPAWRRSMRLRAGRGRSLRRERCCARCRSERTTPGASRRPDDRGPGARGGPPAAEGLARQPSAAAGGAAGAAGDRAGHRARRPCRPQARDMRRPGLPAGRTV